jgi:hypothetical protein
MKHFLFVLLVVILSACAPAPTATPVPSTATPILPTATIAPTATQVPTIAPTATTAPTIAPTATRPPATATQVAAAATAVPAPTFAPNAICANQDTLENLIACIVAKMPRRDTQGYTVPPANALADFKQVAAQMLAGKCDDIALPASLAKIYSVANFKDKQNQASYCAALEILDENANGTIDRGWGTFIVNSNATRELSIQAPHPLADIATDAQAISVFKAVNARSYLLAGSHRDANTRKSTCSNVNEGEADATHNAGTFFQTAVEATADFYKTKDWHAIQFHGMAATTCPNVDAFLSYGVQLAPKPGDKILELRANILKQQPKWSVTVFGETPPCNLYATENVSGRLLNGVPSDQVCTLPASNYSGKFIHIEQKIALRSATADWIAAISATWK